MNKMKPTLPSRSLPFYLTLVILFSYSSNAQIVYTNIKDITYTCNKKCNNLPYSHKSCYDYSCSETYALDLNKDRTADFNINTGREVQNWDGGNGTYCCTSEFSNWVSVSALNDNSVLVPPGSAVMAGSEISSVSAWSTGPGYFKLRWVFRDCQISYSGQCGTIRTEGDWPNSTDRYLGLKIILNGQTHYGWARLSVIVDETKSLFKLMDYALNSTPGQSINAGDTGSGSASKAAFNKEREEDIASSKLNVSPNPVASTATILFMLDHQGNVCLDLYDMTGRLVNKITEREFNEGAHQVTLNTKNLNPGIYLIRLQTQSAVQTRKLIVVK